MVGKNWQLSVIKKNLRNHWLMLLRRCSSAVAMSWQHRRTTLSQYRKLTSPQLSFSTLPQRFDNGNYDVLAVSAGKPLRNKHFWGKYTENTTRVVWLKQVLLIILERSYPFFYMISGSECTFFTKESHHSSL